MAKWINGIYACIILGSLLYGVNYLLTDELYSAMVSIGIICYAFALCDEYCFK